jgi:hypothetical protein
LTDDDSRMIDPFRFCVAMAPLALYLLVLGVVNFVRRPTVVSGARDMMALGLGIAGLVFIGPVELLMPSVPSDLTGYFWVILLLIYALLLTLGVLLGNPRIVVYNVSLEQLRPVLSEVVNDVDADARWAGSSVSLPRLGVEFFLDGNASFRNISLVATATPQSYSGWRTLEKALRAQLKARVESAPNSCALASLVVSLVLWSRMGWLVYAQGDKISQSFQEMMRF